MPHMDDPRLQFRRTPATTTARACTRSKSSPPNKRPRAKVRDAAETPAFDLDAAVEFEAGDEDRSRRNKTPAEAGALHSSRADSRELLARNGCRTCVAAHHHRVQLGRRSRPCIRRNAPVPALVNAFLQEPGPPTSCRAWKPTDRSVSVYALRSPKVSGRHRAQVDPLRSPWYTTAACGSLRHPTCRWCSALVRLPWNRAVTRKRAEPLGACGPSGNGMPSTTLPAGQSVIGLVGHLATLRRSSSR